VLIAQMCTLTRLMSIGGREQFKESLAAVEGFTTRSYAVETGWTDSRVRGPARPGRTMTTTLPR
jgi:hypothetical protein